MAFHSEKAISHPLSFLFPPRKARIWNMHPSKPKILTMTDYDLDSHYVSAWSQAKNARWSNTLLVTIDTNDASLRRTVNYGSDSYTHPLA